MWKRLIKNLTGTLFRTLAWIYPPVAGSLPKDPKLILVFSTTGIGDALFDTAAIRSLRITYPGARIVVCSHRKRRSVMMHDPDVDEVVPYGKAPIHAIRLLWRFRRSRPDLVILLNINPEVVPIAYAINRRALFGGVWRCGEYAYLLSHKTPAPEEGHILRLGGAIAMAAGGSEKTVEMVYRPSEFEITAIRKRFPEWVGKPFVVFQTGGGRSRSWRDWPVESYVRNITWIQRNYALQIVLTGGWDNEKVAGEIEAACPGVVNLCSKTTLEETAALLTQALMLVSTDTGVLFMAYATGCPALAILHHASPGTLIGPTDTGVGHEVVELPKPEKDLGQLYGEMEGIRDEEVQSAISRILEKRGVLPSVPAALLHPEQ